jgi:pyruvate-formate lyase
MTHHRPECEELACEVCNEPGCADRQDCYVGDEAEANVADVVLYSLSEKVDALEADVKQLAETVIDFESMVDHFCAAITKWRAGEPK